MTEETSSASVSSAPAIPVALAADSTPEGQAGANGVAPLVAPAAHTISSVLHEAIAKIEALEHKASALIVAGLKELVEKVKAEL